MNYIEFATRFNGLEADDIEPTAEWLIGRLRELWAEDSVPLSAVVFWIASGGAPVEPDDEAVDRAVSLLLAALKTKAITADGIFRGEDFLRAIPHRYFRYVSKFPPDGDDLFATTSGRPRLFWNASLEEGHANRFLKFVDTILIDDVAIERDAMVKLWPRDTNLFSVAAATAKRGRKPVKINAVMAAMIAQINEGYDLTAATEEEMSALFGASRDTCRNARIRIVGK